MGDAPDGVLLIQIAVTLGSDARPPSAVTEAAISKLDRLTTSSSSYATVVSYTVPAAKTFVLSNIEVAASDYTAARIKLTIAGVEQFTDKALQTSFNPTFALVNLKAADVILLEAKSDGATSIDVDGAIEGKEIS